MDPRKAGGDKQTDSPKEDRALELFVACSRDDEKTARRLIGEGINVNSKRNMSALAKCQNVLPFGTSLTEGPISPLLITCLRGNSSLAEVLLDAGARDKSALYAAADSSRDACKWDRLELVEMLLDRGYKVDFKTTRGRTPLCAAASFGCLDTVLLLLENGAKVNDECVCPPLLSVCCTTPATGKAVDMARLLLEHGADPSVKAENGDSLRKLAKKAGNDDVAEAIAVHLKKWSGAKTNKTDKGVDFT